MISVYNTLSKKKEVFKPLEKNKVRMYVCGPTVYGPAHIGHARTYIAFDIIRRYLELRGFSVNFVLNITDVHDDIIKKANEQGTDIFSLSRKFEKIFLEDMDSLHIKKATHYPRVTDNIKEIIKLVQLLEKKGFAYETDDGVYFSVSKFKDYGKLSGIKLNKTKTGTRIKTDKYDKSNVADFVLWKKHKEGEPFWESPWGKGRPGWHIECSAISAKYLGKQFDLHGGARDLQFPHHENEIAQSEAAFGKVPFVKYWLHSGLLNVAGEKMSKSLGNYIEVRDLLKEFSGSEFRFFISQAHYRSPIDFSKEKMKKAKETLAKFNLFIQRLLAVKAKGKPSVKEFVKKTREKVFREMDDDFNLPNMWAIVFDFERRINFLMGKGKFFVDDAKIVLDFLKELNEFLQVFSFQKEQIKLSAEEKQLLKEREKYRKEKNFKKADEIRAILLHKGIQIDDTADGTVVRRV